MGRRFDSTEKDTSETQAPCWREALFTAFAEPHPGGVQFEHLIDRLERAK